MKWTAIILGGLAILASAAFGWMLYRMNYVPSGLNTASSLASDQGLYNVSYTSQTDPISINQIHSWIVHVESADGQPIENAAIQVDGDMPQHGHGLPTRPQVTSYLGNGDYRVEGLNNAAPEWLRPPQLPDSSQ